MAPDPLNINRIKLDELMGLNRNNEYPHLNTSPPTEITDPRLCHYHLAGYCPYHRLHDLLSSELFIQPCHKIHSDILQTRYLASELHENNVYEEELYSHLKTIKRSFDNIYFSKEMNLKEVAGQSRKSIYKHLKLSEEAKAKAMTLLGDAEEFLKVNSPAAGQRIVALSKQVEELMKVSDNHESIVKGEKEPTSVVSQAAAKTKLCSICLLKLTITDTDERLTEHFSGKRHREMKRCWVKLNELASIFESTSNS